MSRPQDEIEGAGAPAAAGGRVTGLLALGLALGLALALAACGPALDPPPEVATDDPAAGAPAYRISPLDSLNVFVWQAPELSVTVPVRPDGRITMPLVEDLPAAGKTPTELARDVEGKLKEFIQEPIVTVIVTGFGQGEQTVRVVGEAAQPVAIPFQANMTVLDVMVAVGGLTEFAAGNRAVLVRGRGQDERLYGLRLDDLVRRGDVSANRPLLPGDVIIVPKSFL